MRDDKDVSFYPYQMDDDNSDSGSGKEEDDKTYGDLLIKIELYNVIALEICDFEKRTFVPKDKCERGHKMVFADSTSSRNPTCDAIIMGNKCRKQIEKESGFYYCPECGNIDFCKSCL